MLLFQILCGLNGTSAFAESTTGADYSGVIFLGAVSAVAWLARGTGRTGRLAALAAVLLFVQIVVGVVNVLLMLPISLTGLHTALAAGIVLSTGMLVREVLAARTSAPEAVMTSRVAEAR